MTLVQEIGAEIKGRILFEFVESRRPNNSTFYLRPSVSSFGHSNGLRCSYTTMERNHVLNRDNLRDWTNFLSFYCATTHFCVEMIYRAIPVQPCANDQFGHLIYRRHCNEHLSSFVNLVAGQGPIYPLRFRRFWLICLSGAPYVWAFVSVLVQWPWRFCITTPAHAHILGLYQLLNEE